MSRSEFLMPPNPLTNFEIQEYYQKEPKFNGIYSRNNLHKIKDGAYIINLDKYKSIGIHWIASYVNAKNGAYSKINCQSHRKQIYDNKY